MFKLIEDLLPDVLGIEAIGKVAPFSPVKFGFSGFKV